MCFQTSRGPGQTAPHLKRRKRVIQLKGKSQMRRRSKMDYCVGDQSVPRCFETAPGCSLACTMDYLRSKKCLTKDVAVIYSSRRLKGDFEARQ